MTTPHDPAGQPEPEELHDALGGEAVLRAIVAAFYERVPADDVLGPMYAAHLAQAGETLADAERRLADFLVYRLGGDPRYVNERGHPRLRMRHMPFAIDERARDRWVQHMTEAIDGVAPPAPAAAALREFLGGIATFLRNR